MKTISLGFNLWGGVTSRNFFAFLPEIFEHYNFVDEQDPEFIISNKPTRRGKIKIFYTAEPWRPKPSQWDWSFSFHCLGDSSHMRLPNYKRLGAGDNLIKPADYDAEKILSRKTKFCAFVYADGRCQERNDLFHAISKYKKVDSPGPLFNNMDPAVLGKRPGMNMARYALFDRYRHKVRFLKDYKFVICSESTSIPWYTSEKLYHGMLADSIGIYWGNPNVRADFNHMSFLRYTGNMDYLMECLVFADEDDEAYLSLLKAPWLPGNKHTIWTENTRYLNRFQEIFG